MFCPKCGKENADDAQFCISCGSALSQTAAAQPNATPQPATPQPVQPPPGIVCPQCGSTNLTVTTETNVQTTGKNFSLGQACCGNILMGPFGLLCGLCGQGQKTTSTNTTYWVCNNCGKKFKHFDEYEKDIRIGRALFIAFLIFGILIAITLIPLSITTELSTVFSISFCVVLFLLAILGKWVEKKTKKERDELKAQMDKFLQK